MAASASAKAASSLESSCWTRCERCPTAVARWERTAQASWSTTSRFMAYGASEGALEPRRAQTTTNPRAGEA
jgi:hypothetical protein